MASPTKAEMRAAVLAARRAVTGRIHDMEADALCARLPELVAPEQTMCAYVPMRSEPGSIGMLDELLRLDTRVLIPVARSDATGRPEPLRWGEYRPGRLVTVQFGLREPPQPWLSADAVADAAVVLVPALAVDRAGVRLGRGAGFYDRSLPLADPAARLVAVVRDDELVERLPAERHDVPMTHALTPGLGLVTLG